MYWRFIICSIVILAAGLISAHARTIKVQPINCAPKGEKEYCTSVNGYALNGKIAVQNKNGRLGSICEFKKGYRNGESLIFDGHGHLTDRVLFKDGLKDGVSQFYYKNGNVWISAPYIKGLLHGTVDIYDNKQKLRGKFKYDRGQLENGYCKRRGHKVRYPNKQSVVDFNQLVTCGPQ